MPDTPRCATDDCSTDDCSTPDRSTPAGSGRHDSAPAGPPTHRPRTDGRADGAGAAPPTTADPAGPLTRLVADLVEAAVPEPLREALLEALRTTVDVLSSGLDVQSRRNAWGATVEASARARARKEADAAMWSAALRAAATSTPAGASAPGGTLAAALPAEDRAVR